MFSLKDISKRYKVGNFEQKALDSVSLDFNKSDFVAILGPSGSGKTTLLNIIGGLDRYDAGDLIIEGKSTKSYTDRDWDTYRNHTIGFVFQSYNLISHQTVIENVEIALTIGGISGEEKRKRAYDALKQVGLEEHINKKPNQLSGGQMQRVAIARALVNNPKIVLADEPTGALDTSTGLAVMEILKEIAKDRLVVMVTHNPELASEYATRIIKIKDGKIEEDVRTKEEKKESLENFESSTSKKPFSKMSFNTALKLSLNNLKTKLARTVLISIAGSIGIIGIALILAISMGMNNFIIKEQKESLTSYPITIKSDDVDYSAALEKNNSFKMRPDDTREVDNGKITAKVNQLEPGVILKKNNLKAFKEYLDNKESPINKYIHTGGISYTYNMNFSVFAKDPNNKFVNTSESVENKKSLDYDRRKIFANSGNAYNFSQLNKGNDEEISESLKSNQEILAGSFPKNKDEVVIALNKNNELDLNVLYQLGIISYDEYNKIEKTAEKENKGVEVLNISPESLIGKEFYLIPNYDLYKALPNNMYEKVKVDTFNINNFIDKSIKLKVVGVVRPINTSKPMIASPVAYLSSLTDYLMEESSKNPIIQKQLENKEVDIFNNIPFKVENDEQKEEYAKKYILSLPMDKKAQLALLLNDENTLPSDNNAYLASYLDAYILQNPNKEELIKVYDAYLSNRSYENNLKDLGYVNKNMPDEINIYVDSFNDKDGVVKSINEYNSKASEENKIVYTDFIGIITNTFTKVIKGITSVLIAFVSVSLIVSSIMIGIITHISVMERTKEIGVLRALGASKGNISQVFNAETILIGLFAGIIGVGMGYLLSIPITFFMRSVLDAKDLVATLSPVSALLLIGLSVLVTFIGGLIPAIKAAKKDPVIALRSE